MKRIAQIAVLLGGVGLLSGCAGAAVLNPNSPVAADESNLYQIITAMAAVVFVLVEGLVIYAVIRYRRRDQKLAQQIHGNQRLEITWTVIPILLVIVVFGLTFHTMQTVAAPAPTNGDLRVRVVGHQWWFEYDYPDLNIVTANDLHIPVNTNVYFDLVSVDVIHSFWVPQLSGKIDVIPGQTNHLWFRADKPGEFSGQCAEYCGLNHANMRIKVVAQSQADFQAWVANQQKPPVAPQTDQQKQAQALLTNGLCITCHSFGGKAAINPVGPDLSHLYSRTTFAGSMFALTDDNLRRWLQNTQAMKPGNDMNINLTPQQIDALMAYLPTLK